MLHAFKNLVRFVRSVEPKELLLPAPADTTVSDVELAELLLEMEEELVGA